MATRSSLCSGLLLGVGRLEDAVAVAPARRSLISSGDAAGYRSNGEPGERPRYHDGYYAAFVLDPDGNNIEVVNHHRG
jgi:hypothetical protein